LIDKELKKKLKDFEDKQAEISKAGKTLADDVIGTLKDLITSSNLIEAAQWKQYTPGFNDGDACEFSVMDIEVKLSESVMKEFENQEIETVDEEFWDDYSLKLFLKKHMDVLNHEQLGLLESQIEAVSELHGVLSGMESELERRFGNNMKITLTKKGIETEDYDCGY
jgi:hypothetical protein